MQASVLRHVANIPIRQDIIGPSYEGKEDNAGSRRVQAGILHPRVSGVKGHGWNSWSRLRSSFGGDPTNRGPSTACGVLP